MSTTRPPRPSTLDRQRTVGDDQGETGADVVPIGGKALGFPGSRRR